MGAAPQLSYRLLLESLAARGLYVSPNAAPLCINSPKRHGKKDPLSRQILSDLFRQPVVRIGLDCWASYLKGTGGEYYLLT